MRTEERRLSVRSLVEPTGLPFTAAHYEPRATIFHQGDDGDSVMHVEAGRVELSSVAHNGKGAICGLLNSGDFLGEEALVGCVERPYTATAMASTEVLIIARSTIVQLLATQPKLAGRFIEHSVTRTARLRSDLADQLLYSCEERLARVLMALADLDDRAPNRYVLPNVTQEFIARMVGTTRSRVNHFLGKFKKLGFVEERGGVLTLNPAMLFAVPGGEGAIPPPDGQAAFGADGYF